MVKAIVTMPPYAPHMDEVLRHSMVEGIRLNTVMPTKDSDSLEDLVKRMNSRANMRGKDLWIDLKCRQLRVTECGVPPFTEINVSHEVEVDTPVTAYFSDGEETATVLEADGDRLIMQGGPKRVVGPGESVNIPDDSLKINGYLTDKDKRYIEAANEAGVHNYMISFVEQEGDEEELYSLDSEANLVSKIESARGLEYLDDGWKGETRLMAGRGDLYVEMEKPHRVMRATEKIIDKDPEAIAASRIFTSLAYTLEPECSEISDVDNLLRMGYETLMIGDDVAQERESVMSALNLLRAVAEPYQE